MPSVQVYIDFAVFGNESASLCGNAVIKNQPSRCGRADEKGFIMRFGVRRVRFPPSHDFEKSAFDFFACLAVAALFGCGNCGRRCDAGKEKHHRKNSCFEVAACARALAACAAI